MYSFIRNPRLIVIMFQEVDVAGAVAMEVVAVAATVAEEEVLLLVMETGRVHRAMPTTLQDVTLASGVEFLNKSQRYVQQRSRP